MLTSKCVWAYREQFGNHNCAFAEPGNQIMIFNKETGISYLSPTGETDVVFFDRLARSQSEGRNLFYEEWDPFEL